MMATDQPDSGSRTMEDSIRDQGDGLPPDWADVLADEVSQPYWTDLQRYVAAERAAHDVYPAPENVFAAFRMTPVEKVRVVVLGQDPYFNPGEATGLAFAVPVGTRIPPSLRTILSELRSDLGVTAQSDLTGWARQGVLLLNTTLTVRRGKAKSHERQGWETFTDAVIQTISDRREGVVFVLWGEAAGRKKRLVDGDRHHVIEAAHPRARSTARDPIKGSRPFSRINQWLPTEPIDWAAQ